MEWIAAWYGLCAIGQSHPPTFASRCAPKMTPALRNFLAASLTPASFFTSPSSSATPSTSPPIPQAALTFGLAHSSWEPSLPHLAMGCILKAAVKAAVPLGHTAPPDTIQGEVGEGYRDYALGLGGLLMPLLDPTEEGGGERGDFVRYMASVGVLRLVRFYWRWLGAEVYMGLSLTL